MSDNDVDLVVEEEPVLEPRGGTVTTTRPLDLAQLAGEIGCDLVVSTAAGESEVTALDPDVDAEQLQAAVDAHTPTPAAAPTLAELQARLDEIAAQIAALQD